MAQSHHNEEPTVPSAASSNRLDNDDAAQQAAGTGEATVDQYGDGAAAPGDVAELRGGLTRASAELDDLRCGETQQGDDVHADEAHAIDLDAGDSLYYDASTMASLNPFSLVRCFPTVRRRGGACSPWIVNAGA